MHQSPFALRYHTIHRSAANPFVEINTRELGEDGIAFRHLSHLRGVWFVRVVFLIVDRLHDAGDSSHVITSGSIGESSLFKKSPEWVLSCWDVIDIGNQKAGVWISLPM